MTNGIERWFFGFAAAACGFAGCGNAGPVCQSRCSDLVVTADSDAAVAAGLGDATAQAPTDGMAPNTDAPNAVASLDGSAGHTDGGGTEGGGVGDAAAGPVGDGGVVQAFSQCRFHFGTIDSVAKRTTGLIPQLDMFTPGWIGQSDTFDMKYVCDETNPGGALAGVVPAMVSYIIAFTARRDACLSDCNANNVAASCPSTHSDLCKGGATYIRAHLNDRILPQYKMYAQGFAQACGTTRPLIWLMEPDYYQYSAGGDPMSLSAAEAGQIMGQLVATVKQYLPNAVFSLDVSPWIPNNGAAWYSNFNMSDFTFINTSGGGTDANNTKIRATNAMTWAGVHNVTHKPILADTGYGAAGSPSGPDPIWDVVANINARIADGVVSITQYNPGATWPATIMTNRPQLSPVPCY